MDLNQLRSEVTNELTSNILPFWMNRMLDGQHGGFYGRISGSGQLMPEADKGAILHARILWTFSAAYRLLGDEAYLDVATRAKRYLIDRFYDPLCGGVYWSLHADGTPADTKKQIYAIGFAIYGLSEYARATADPEALHYARLLFDDIERHSFDPVNNGYLEAFDRQWGALTDMRLSDKDANECKTMNTHLHILEAYTALYRVWKDARLQKQLCNLLHLFMQKIINQHSGHLQLFFNDLWQCHHRIRSYGHDIETSWLLHEAAFVLGDSDMIDRIEPHVEFLAAAADEGLAPDGSMMYESIAERHHTDTNRHWWVQAENVLGHLNLYQYFDDGVALRKAFRAWEYIKQYLIDPEQGEWYWSADEQGRPNRTDDKAGFWKCPYHNGRMCIEIIERFPADTL